MVLHFIFISILHRLFLLSCVWQHIFKVHLPASYLEWAEPSSLIAEKFDTQFQVDATIRFFQLLRAGFDSSALGESYWARIQGTSSAEYFDDCVAQPQNHETASWCMQGSQLYIKNTSCRYTKISWEVLKRSDTVNELSVECVIPGDAFHWTVTQAQSSGHPAVID